MDEFEKKKGEAIPESGGKPKGQLPSLPVIIYVARASGDYGATFVSENVREKTGYDAEDFTKNSGFWADHLHPDDKKFVFAKLPSLINKGHWAMRYRFKHKDESYRWMYEEARMVYDEKGRPQEIIGYWTDITELGQLEEEARHNREMLRCVCASAPVAVACLDLNAKISDCNQATLDLHGYISKSELVGKSAFNLIAKRDHLRTIANLKRALEEKAVTGVECAFVKRDGSEFPAEFSIAVVTDAEGNPASFMAITMDISRRRQAEKERRDSEERLKIIFEEAPDAYFLIDLDGEFIDCNKAAERLTGYTKEEMIGKTFSELRLLPPDQIPAAFEGIAEAMEHKITGLDRYVLIRKDRTEAVVEIKAQAVDIKDKTLFLGVVRDITARSMAERDLLLRNQLIESSASAAAISDPAGVLSYVNHAFLKMWGYDEAREVLGRSALDFWQERGKASQAMAKVKQQGFWEGKLFVRKKDGTTRKVEVSARAAVNKEGEPVGMTASFRD